MSSASDRTEKPSPRKLIKARREGQFPSSKDFVSGLQFTVFVLLLAELGPKMFTGFKDAAGAVLRQALRADVGNDTLVEIVHQAFAQTIFPLLTGSAIMVASGVLFQLLSTRFSFSLQRLAPKPVNFNPISKLKSAP